MEHTTKAGQVYHVVEEVPHTTRSGRATVLLRWAAPCVVCGAEFTTTTSRSRPPEVRTCEEHRGTLPRTPSYAKRAHAKRLAAMSDGSDMV